jgi:uncharacterized membrane protein YeiH
MFYTILVIAIAAEAMTGAIAAGRRKMDWFGVCVIAVVTALGGGTMRDVLLGHYPLLWVNDPNLLLLACAAALVTIAGARYFEKLRWAFLVLDGLGLVVFTILGCNVAIEMGMPPVIVIVSGMITGIAGGIMRDVLCNDVPLVFSAELYATVSIVTGVIYYGTIVTGVIYYGAIGLGLQTELAVAVALLVGFPMRLCAIIFKWVMPRFIYDRDGR